jgi:hypothetical protein
MATGTRIPRGIDDFNTYITNTSAYLLTGEPVNNAERLSILPEESTQWKSFSDKWLPDYQKYKDKKNSRTIAVRDKLVQIISDTIDYDQKNRVLDRIAASPNVEIEDLGMFNINIGILKKTRRSVSLTPIVEPVTVTIQPLGGGSVTIKCYSTTGQRSAIYSDADSVQYLYMVADAPPASADAPGLMKEISTRATFTMSLGSASSGNKLYIYFRWYSTKHPELAGPWSGLQTTLIL